MTEAPLDDLRRAVYRPVRSGNALEDTTARIVQTVRLGLVAPGESLPAERELAALYGVSRDTVREALRELSDAGWLETRRGRYGGTFVVDPVPRPSQPAVVSAAELSDVIALRGILEPGAAWAAAARALSAEERDVLWARHEAAAHADGEDYRRLDTLLHLTIAEFAGIPSLVPLVADNRARVNAWLDTFPLLPRNIEHSTSQHAAVVSAILAGRPDAAHAAMRDHLAGSEALLRGFLA